MPKGKLLRNTLQPFTSQLRACVWVSLPCNNNGLSLFLGIDQAAMQACSSVQTGNTPDLPFAGFSGDLELSCLTLGLTTGSSFPSDSTTMTEASLCSFATFLLLSGTSASSSLSDSEEIPGEKNQWEDGAIHVLQDHFMCA